MGENQTNQNLNQQPVQPVQPQSEQVQQPVQQQSVQWQAQAAEQPSVSMQIQQLLVQQQQYQQQYNQLVDYVKKTPNLPIEQVNQIKAQLDQLNALFVQGKQQLQALWYNQVQVQKPTEVKKWAKNNFSFKKLAIWCGIVVLLILAWFFVTLSSLIKNPAALQWIWVNAAMAKTLLQIFTGLLFWSIIILMLWVIISNIYRLITVKNQSKGRYVLWLIWWLFWAWLMWAGMWVVFWMIGKIETEVVHISYAPVQAYLIWQWQSDFSFPYDKNKQTGNDYYLIAPSEFAFAVRGSELSQLQLPSESTLISMNLVCWNKQNQILPLLWDVNDLINWWTLAFQWACLYWEKWKYNYSLNVEYRNNLNKEIVSKTYELNTLDFTSEFIITSSSSSKNARLLPSMSWKSEFNVWEAPTNIRIDATQIFRDFGLESYNLLWDKEWDNTWDIENLSSFDVYYNRPQVYHPTIKFPDLSDFIYTFPIRVEQSKNPICELKLEKFPWTTKYKIKSEFIDWTLESSIALYKYTIKNSLTNESIAVIDNSTKEVNYTFPQKWSYVVRLDFMTVDQKKSWCQSDILKLEKETFNVDYFISGKSATSSKFTELCWSASTNECDVIRADSVPYAYQLKINSITPQSNTMQNSVYLDDKPIMDDNWMYSFDIVQEWEYSLKIITSDMGMGMDEEVREIKIIVKKPNIIWKISILDSSTRKEIYEWFEPVSVILDASKTEINVPWDEIVYFSWDFGDWEVKQNQQNGVVAHTYNYDYKNEKWVFQPKVTITTREGLTETITWPKLNVKKWLIHVDLSSTSHPSMQASLWKDVVFEAEFDWLPEKMIWDFGDGSPAIECKSRTCTEIVHAFEKTWLFSVTLTLVFDAIQQVDWSVDFKVY